MRKTFLKGKDWRKLSLKLFPNALQLIFELAYHQVNRFRACQTQRRSLIPVMTQSCSRGWKNPCNGSTATNNRRCCKQDGSQQNTFVIINLAIRFLHTSTPSTTALLQPLCDLARLRLALIFVEAWGSAIRQRRAKEVQKKRRSECELGWLELTVSTAEEKVRLLGEAP